MARNDGVDRISARNVNLSSGKIGNTQRHKYCVKYLVTASRFI